MTSEPFSSVFTTSTRRAADAAVVLFALIVSYSLATTTGLPVFHPDPEPVDGLALATKGIEAVGLLTATSLLRRPLLTLTPSHLKGT